MSESLEAQLDLLVGTYLGSSRSEVITFILKEWLLAKREQLDHRRRLNTLESETGNRLGSPSLKPVGHRLISTPQPVSECPLGYPPA